MHFLPERWHFSLMDLNEFMNLYLVGAPWRMTPPFRYFIMEGIWTILQGGENI